MALIVFAATFVAGSLIELIFFTFFVYFVYVLLSHFNLTEVNQTFKFGSTKLRGKISQPVRNTFEIFLEHIFFVKSPQNNGKYLKIESQINLTNLKNQFQFQIYCFARNS